MPIKYMTLKPLIFVIWVISYIFVILTSLIIWSQVGTFYFILAFFFAIVYLIAIILSIKFGTKKKYEFGLYSWIFSLISVIGHAVIYFPLDFHIGEHILTVILILIVAGITFIDWHLLKEKDLENINTKSTSKKMACPFCGAEVIDSSGEFCSKCGSSLK